MSTGRDSPVRDGCILCLLQTSASMVRRFSFKGKEHRKLRVARQCLDQFLDWLVLHGRQGEAVTEGLQVGVVGYTRASDGGAALTPLLAGAEREPYLISLTELQERPGERRPGGVGRWVRLPSEPTAEVPMSAVLARAYRLVQQWLHRHPDGRPPLVIHWCDGSGHDAAHAVLARSLQLMRGNGGPSTLCHVIWNEEFKGAFRLLSEEEPPTGRWQQLWKASSRLGVSMGDGTRWAGRALLINREPLSVL